MIKKERKFIGSIVRKNSVKCLAWMALSSFAFLSCSDNDDVVEPKVEEFKITDYYIGGTISPKSNAYKSVFFIKLLADNKAVFVSSGNDLSGSYTITDDSLKVVVEDPNNYREAKFAVNKEHQLTSAYYKALTMEYKATGTLLKMESENQLAGKTFKGEEFKMGPVSNNLNWFYQFDASGNQYGSGEDQAAISKTNMPEVIGNSAFKYKNGDITEMGFLSGDSLTVFRYQGLYYFGSYKLQ